MSVQVLTAKEVATTVLKKWDKLGATNDETECLYDYGDGIGCAIGVCLTETSLRSINMYDVNNVNINALVERDLVRIGDNTISDCKVIQRLHDEACYPSDNDMSNNQVNALSTLRMFCEMLAEGETL